MDINLFDFEMQPGKTLKKQNEYIEKEAIIYRTNYKLCIKSNISILWNINNRWRIKRWRKLKKIRRNRKTR